MEAKHGYYWTRFNAQCARIKGQRGTIPQTTVPQGTKALSWMRCAMHGLRDEQEAAFQESLQLDREKQARKEAGAVAGTVTDDRRGRSEDRSPVAFHGVGTKRTSL